MSHYNHQEVCAIWAGQEEDRCGSGNVFVDGDTIYSYGLHFPMARHVSYKHRYFVLYNSRKYSQSTSRHQLYVRTAIHRAGLDSVSVPNLFPDRHGHEDNLCSFSANIFNAAQKVVRARSCRRYAIGDLTSCVEQGNLYCDLYGLKRNFESPLDMYEQWEITEAAEERARAAEEKRRELRRLRDEADNAQYQDRLNLWRLGYGIDQGFLPGLVPDCARKFTAALRLRGQYVETSLPYAPKITINDLVGLLDLSRARTDAVLPVSGDGVVYLGHHVLCRASSDGSLHTDYNFISADEIERVAMLLGLWPDGQGPPDAYRRMLAQTLAPKPAEYDPRKMPANNRRRRSVRIYDDE